MIKTLSISGFRGFGKEQTIEFSMPDGKTEGSGFNVIVGANNSGKTTIIESIRAFNGHDIPSFSEGKRNKRAGGRIRLMLTDERGRLYLIGTARNGGSSGNRDFDDGKNYSVIPSRRSIPFEFGKTNVSRDEYVSKAMKLGLHRESTLDDFGERIFGIERGDKGRFNNLLQEVLGFSFEWKIEQRDSGSYYVKCEDSDIVHGAEGSGDGIWSIFVTCSALFDAPKRSVIVIDEPELSLHPSLQKRLLKVLLRFSKDHQIIISTHSPYFISWEAIASAKAGLIRISKNNGDSTCHQLGDEVKKSLSGFLDDIYNPHVLGLVASEIFFMEDNIILVEGQEDVVLYRKIAKKLGKEFKGNFFGWGVGGASKMELFLSIFRQLGYRKVVAIFDGDKKSEAARLVEVFPEYRIETIPADDIRDKEERKIKGKVGITDIRGNLKNEYKDDVCFLVDSINSWFSDNQ